MQNVRKQKDEKEIKFHFASTDIKYRHNRDAGKLEFVSTKGSRMEVTSSSIKHAVLEPRPAKAMEQRRPLTMSSSIPS